MIHELREYTLDAALWPRYRELFLTVAGPVRGDAYGRMLGAWVAEPVGLPPEDRDDLIRFAHLWEYESLDQRAQLRVELSLNERWTKEFLPHAGPLVRSQQLSVLHPQPDSGDWFRLESGELHLHRWQCVVGKGSALLPALRKQANLCWSTEFPDPNSIACLAVQAKPPVLGGNESIRARHSLVLKPLV